MRNYGIITLLAVGCTAASGIIVLAAPPQDENYGNVAAYGPAKTSPAAAASTPVEIHLLDKDGKTIAQVTVEFPKGQGIEIGANKFTSIAGKKGAGKRTRLEGDIYIKTLRGSVSTTLLKVNYRHVNEAACS